MKSYVRALYTESYHLYNVDEYLIAPMFGFKDRFDYYSSCCVTGKLNQIKIPCFFLHALDDIVIR